MKTRILQTGPTWNNETGFTFIEILIVLVIMSLMISIVIPNFSQMFASIEGAREGEKVLRLLKKVRAEAILQAEPMEIEFHENGRAIFQIGDETNEYEDLRVTLILQDGEEGKQTFNPDGTAEVEMLTFKTPEGKYLIFSFNPISGKIEMERRTER